MRGHGARNSRAAPGTGSVRFSVKHFHPPPPLRSRRAPPVCRPSRCVVSSCGRCLCLKTETENRRTRDTIPSADRCGRRLRFPDRDRCARRHRNCRSNRSGSNCSHPLTAEIQRDRRIRRSGLSRVSRRLYHLVTFQSRLNQYRCDSPATAVRRRSVFMCPRASRCDARRFG